MSGKSEEDNTAPDPKENPAQDPSVDPTYVPKPFKWDGDEDVGDEVDEVGDEVDEDEGDEDEEDLDDDEADIHVLEPDEIDSPLSAVFSGFLNYLEDILDEELKGKTTQIVYHSYMAGALDVIRILSNGVYVDTLEGRELRGVPMSLLEEEAKTALGLSDSDLEDEDVEEEGEEPVTEASRQVVMNILYGKKPS